MPIKFIRVSLAWLVLTVLLISVQVQAGPKIESWQTSNGARVLFVESPELPMLDLRIVFDAGSARDGELPGLGSMVNGLLVDGAGDWDADQIAMRFESVGAEQGQGSMSDMAWLTLRTLTEKNALKTSLETLSVILSRPNFEADDIERNRQLMLAGLKQEAQSPQSVVKKAFYSKLFASHPYAIHAGGTEESLNAIDRAAIQAHYKRYYVASNAVIALVGQIDRKQAEQIAEHLTSQMETGKPAEPLPEVKPLQQVDKSHISFPSSQSHILIGQPGMYRGDPDYFTLYVGNHILGGSGLVSRMSEEVREKRGLSYSVYSYFSPMRRQGPFLMSVQTKNVQADEATSVMMDTLLEFIHKGPTEQELKEAKQNITGGYPIRIAGNKNIVEYLGMIGFYNLPLTYLDDFVGKINGVTLEAINDAFKRRLDPEKMIWVTVGDKG